MSDERTFGSAPEAVQWASTYLRSHRGHVKGDPTFKDYLTEGVMRVVSRFNRDDDESAALTILAVAERVESPQAREMFLFLFGEWEEERLHYLSGQLNAQVRFPVPKDRQRSISHHVSVHICKYLLLRQHRYANNAQFKGLPAICDLGHKAHVGCKRFISWADKEVYPTFRMWQDMADRHITDELVAKGVIGG